MTDVTITTLGRSTFRHENGLSYNALGLFCLPVTVMLLSSSMMLCMFSVGPRPTSIWMICMPFSCRVSDLACCAAVLFICEMQRSDGSTFTTWGQVHLEGWLMPWLLMGHVSSCLEVVLQTHSRMIFPLFTFLTRVCTFALSFDSLRD